MHSLSPYDAIAMLREATTRHNIHLSVLVAETSLWAHPAVHRALLADNGSGAFFPNRRRGRQNQGELRGTSRGNIFFDDNTYANTAIKRVLGLDRKQFIGFEACHIWRDSCYDERYHTAIANLVLLPRPLAGLSDHDAEIEQVLHYRAYELYDGWYPEGRSVPSKPSFYPPCWREPLPFTRTVANALARRKLPEPTLMTAD